MIALNHLPLSNIAVKHHDGITPWAFTKRLEPIFKLYEETMRHQHQPIFPDAELKKLKVALGPKTKIKQIAIFKGLFDNKKELNDGFKVLELIYKNWYLIITEKPEQLLKFSLLVEPVLSVYRWVGTDKKIHTEPIFAPIFDWLEHIFDYESKFISKEKLATNWDAYRLAEALQVDVCPYCNRQYTNTVIHQSPKSNPLTFDKVIRPEFDHFFPQSIYSYLALSFYNLVPSCYFCNSSLKGSTKMDLEKHIHPYLGGYHDLIRFRTGIDVRDFLKNTTMELPVTMQVIGPKSKQLDRAEITLELFKLEKIYKIHAEVAREIFKKTTNNSKKYLKRARVESPHGSRLFTSEKQLYRHFVGNYMTAEEFHQRPLAKFQHDIAEETGLLKFIRGIK